MMKFIQIPVACTAIVAGVILAPRPACSDVRKEALNTIAEVGAALQRCLRPPASNMSRTGMQITYRVAFTRIGEILGKPIITFESPDASDEERLRYRISVAEALTRCTPLPFTEALGNAIAGRPISIRLIDERGQRRI